MSESQRPPGAAQPAAHISRDVRLLAVTMLAFPAFQGLVQTLLPLFMDSLGVPATTVGLVQAVPGVVALLSAPPLARLANTKWRRAALAGSFGAGLLAALVLYVARDVRGLLVPQLLVGLATSAFYANMLPSAFRLAEGEQQHRIQGQLTVAQGIGFFSGPLLAGYLAERSFPAGFLAGAVCALLGLVAAAALSPSRGIETGRGPWREWWLSYRRLAQVVTRRPTVLVGVAYVFMNIAVLLVMGGSFFLLYTDRIGVAPLVAAAMLSGRELLGALVRLSYTAVSRRTRTVTLIGAGTVLGSLCIALLPLAHGVGGLVALSAGIGLSIAYMLPAINMLAGASAAPEEQSFAVVGLNLSNFAAQTIMAPVFGLLVSLLGYGLAYPLVGGVWSVVAFLLTLRGLRYEPEAAQT